MVAGNGFFHPVYNPFKGNEMKLTSEQIAAIRNAAPELADKLEAGEAVTVEREVAVWSPRESFLRHARHAKETNATLSLLAYREEFAPGYVVPESGCSAWFLAREGRDWKVCNTYGFRPVGLVYMPEDVCKELCRKLNSGEVVL